MAENQNTDIYPGAYPGNTPIPQMVSPDLAPVLSQYSNITKADLMAMHGYGRDSRVAPEEFGLTSADVHTIREVFAAETQLEDVRGHLATAPELSISCCSCTPCCSCCAASQDDPILN